jgi:hypothetical protein
MTPTLMNTSTGIRILQVHDSTDEPQSWRDQIIEGDYTHLVRWIEQDSAEYGCASYIVSELFTGRSWAVWRVQ